MKKNLNQIFSIKGYFVLENAIPNKTVDKIIEEINSIKDADFYFDKNNKLRRIERLYNKGEELNRLNDFIMNKMKKIFNESFLIFKDKFNAKPPGGKGFFPHFDGIFKFKDKENKIKKGWYEYGNNFINALVALDKCTEENGTIELATKYKNNNFNDLIKFTKNNGTPEINDQELKKNKFKKIILNKGDIVFFSNICPHKSDENKSKLDRRTLYYTYLNEKSGFQYENYFNDKKNSKNNTSKSLDN